MLAVAAPTKLRGLVGADDAWTFVMFMVQWNDETVNGTELAGRVDAVPV